MGVISDAALRALLPLAQELGYLDLFAADSQRMHGSGARPDLMTRVVNIFGTCPTCLALVESSRWSDHLDWHRPRTTTGETVAATETERPIALGPGAA